MAKQNKKINIKKPVLVANTINGRIKPPNSNSYPDWYYSDSRHFAFSFTFMPKSNYDIEHVQSDDLIQLIKKLKKYSSMTWEEIKHSGRHQSGTEIIKRDALKVGIPTSVSNDVNILAFRFRGKKPFLGYRNGKIFHILYIDHNFTLYNH